MTIKQFIDFKKHYTKHKATLIDMQSTYVSRKKSYGYSPIYSYIDKFGTEHKVVSNIYTSSKPTIGKTKEIYINVNNPNVYYNSVIDIILPLIVFSIFTSGFIYATYCIYIETF